MGKVNNIGKSVDTKHRPESCDSIGDWTPQKVRKVPFSFNSQPKEISPIEDMSAKELREAIKKRRKLEEIRRKNEQRKEAEWLRTCERIEKERIEKELTIVEKYLGHFCSKGCQSKHKIKKIKGVLS